MNDKSQLTAFDRGRKAGLESVGAQAPNPFPAGSPDHRNFALGVSFGTRDAVERADFKVTRPEASAPDPDEIDE